MSDSSEATKRRIDFLINERQQKQAEVERLLSGRKITGVSGALHTLLGDSSATATRTLELQQTNERINDLNSQIRALDFEISNLRNTLSSSSSSGSSVTGWWSSSPVQKKTGEEDPIQILKRRLAKGEISKQEYEDIKKSIES